MNDAGITSDADTTDSVCDIDTTTSDLECTLKAAIEQANSDSSQSYEILIGSGRYCADQVFEISAPVAITGNSDGSTIIDGGNAHLSSAACAAAPSGERIFKVTSGYSFSISYLTLMGGTNSEGGNAIYTEDSVTLSISHSSLMFNGRKFLWWWHLF